MTTSAAAGRVRDAQARGPFAVIGDVHGHFDLAWLALHEALERAQVAAGSLTAIFCVGDVEAIRTHEEMLEVHGPAKYRTMGTFEQVLDGSIQFPAPVYFIGGNHEPWASLDADGGLSQHGGRWAPGVSYLGRAGVLDVAGLRVAFLSGIRSAIVSPGTAADRPRPKSPGDDRKRRTYWVQEEVERVIAAGRKRPVDVLLTHDWPSGVGTDRRGEPTGCADVRRLLERVNPKVSFHGHMHHPMRARIAGTAVHCLDHIRSGLDAVAVFDTAGDGTLTRLH